MKQNKLVILVFFNLLALLLSPALVAGTLSGQFEIRQGTAISSGGFCPSPGCEVITAEITGSFSASITNGSITITSQSISTNNPNIDFSLPKQSGQANAVVSELNFNFDGSILMLWGFVDSQAFDGPLITFKLSAMLVPGTGPEAFVQHGYFSLRPDFRRCISPLCGGAFVKKVNRRFTRCADGKYLKECYVAELSSKLLGFDLLATDFASLRFVSPLLVRVRIKSKYFKGFGNLGAFRLESAYRPASSVSATGLYVGVQNNGIVCITSPCFSFDQFPLNSRRMRIISGFDLTEVGANQKDIDEAYQIIGQGNVLLAAGFNRQVEGFAGQGVTFFAEQFFLPIKPEIGICPDGYDQQGTDCITPFGCVAPQLQLDTIGGVPLVDPVTGGLIASITSSCDDSCEFPAMSSGPGRCTLALP